jgi:hypothetical protein
MDSKPGYPTIPLGSSASTAVGSIEHYAGIFFENREQSEKDV